MPKLWRLQPLDQSRVNEVQRGAGVSALVAQLLLCRNISAPAAAKKGPALFPSLPVRTMGATESFRPPQQKKVVATRLLCSEPMLKFEQTLRIIICHHAILRQRGFERDKPSPDAPGNDPIQTP